MVDMLREALYYVEKLNWAVIPLHSIVDGKCTCSNERCRSAGKHPRTEHGSHDASSDKVQVREWWRQWPDANVGIATGEVNNIIVIDIDPKNGGNESFKELIKAHGSAWPKTLTVITGSGGKHLYYRYSNVTLIKHPTGIDFRSNGNLVVAPPSIHASGVQYSWENGRPTIENKLRPLPKWVRTTQAKKAQATRELPKSVWRKGERNSNLTSIAGKMRRQGFEEPVILAACLSQNKLSCEPPLPDSEVEKIVHSVTRYDAADTLPISNGDMPAKYADKDNARRLVNLHGDSIVFTEALGWLVWAQTHWKRDPKGNALLGKAFDVSQVITEEAEHASDDREHKRIMNEALKAGNSRNASDTVKAASTLADVRIEDSQLDSNPWLLNVLNGTIDLRTGKLRAFEREDFITKVAPVRFNDKARAPRFMQFLQETFQDEHLIAFMQRLLGYCLTGDVSEQVFIIFWGIGGNGKTKLVEDVMRHILGDDYATQVSGNAITDAKFANQTATANAKLLGKRFATASESGTRKRLDEENIKRITGGDSINAKFLYRDEFEFHPTHKVILITNHKPRVSASPSMARRLLLVPFEHTPAVIDRQLGEKLQAEASGILNWLVQGCLEWQRMGLNPPAIVRHATQEYREEEDYLGQFLKEMCSIRASRQVTIDAFYRTYALWCTENGVHPLGKITLGKEIFERFNGLKRYRSDGKARWRGIGLRKSDMEV